MALNRLASARRFFAPLTARAASWWGGVEQGPPDAIFGLVEAHKKDPRPEKVNLAIGAYRGSDGKPLVLPTVKKAEKILYDRALDKEYAGIMGYESFSREAYKLAFGEDQAYKDNLFVTAQTVSGTGSLRLGGMFLGKFFPNEKTIYLPSPSWPNHTPVFKQSGLEVKSYRHYDPKTCNFDDAGCYEDLKNLPERSMVLFHACAQNPTGVDLNMEQWAEVSRICKSRNHFVVVDMAYQGFATGDLERDSAGLCLLIKDGHNLMLCQSFSKNMGLYGERCGALTFICSNEKEKKAVESQLKILVRPLYSNPPIYGARIATEILTNPELYQEWLGELKMMAGRIFEMRDSLKAGLEKAGSTRDWSHVTQQIGMFCYSGLNQEQVERLKSDHAIYMTKDGRISMVSLTPKNIDYVVSAIHAVSK